LPTQPPPPHPNRKTKKLNTLEHGLINYIDKKLKLKINLLKVFSTKLLPH
jgi:hypothetical protein